MSTLSLDTKNCKIEVRKYVLIPQSSRWQKKRERVVVQSPMLNITKDVSLVPVRRFNGEQQNAVCFLPRTDIEKDTSDTYQRLHVNKSSSSIEAHGVAICDSSPSNDFSYCRNDRFWIHVDSKTEEYKHTVPVINLRTYKSGVIQVDHVCWLPKIHSTSMYSAGKAPGEELWTPGGSARQCKLSGSKKYALWSFVVCQYNDGTKPVGKSVMIPAKDNQTGETRHLSVNESNHLFESRWRLMQARFGSSSPPQPLATLPITPPASPEHSNSRKSGRGKDYQSNHIVSVPVDRDCWARIKDMASRRPAQSDYYVLRNSSIHPQRSLDVTGSADRGRSASISLLTEEYESDWSSGASSCSSSRNVSPGCTSSTASLKRTQEGQRVNDRIVVCEALLMLHANENLEARHDRLAFSAADPSIAQDPTLISAEWKANRPERNPKLDGLCQSKDPHCPYITNYTCRHFHPDPAKCRLDKEPDLELHEPSTAKLSKQWDSWFDANNGTPRQDRHMDHEHCITRVRPYPAGAGDCLLAANPRKNHRCCDWNEKDFDGISQNYIREYNRSKHAEAERHRVAIFDQSTLVRTENRLPDHGITEDQLGLGGQMLQIELSHGDLGSELEHFEMDQLNMDILECDNGHQDIDQLWSDALSYH
ncbi:hypothetical protein ONS95_009891 [Cadophora gregata]|uniref:uncharacterized protein n=1 Tax=Cadophora gregata TaxID=51156 RepID=UPI0026DB7332|nr:uncharacterized protein ONS95_009891 [Cadophora gregata]KAK0121602.1 hypothetical protein ONS95_009891 [Cadophora gregata]